MSVLRRPLQWVARFFVAGGLNRQRRNCASTLIIWSLFLCIFAACSSLNATQTSSDIATPVVQAKLLATLFLSPTPNDQDREATRLAVRSVPPTAAPTNIPAPTAYIGVFVGDAGGVDSGVPIIAPTQLQSLVTTGVPTLAPAGCTYPVDPVFGTAWTSNTSAVSDLGCAGEPSTPYVGTQEIFEHGVMYWIPSGEIWSISPSGGIDGKFWSVQQAPTDQGWTVPPPSGLRMPQQGFGAVWKAVDGVRQTLGFARLDEQSASLAIQRFDHGALIRDETAGQTFILIGSDNGSAYGPY